MDVRVDSMDAAMLPPVGGLDMVVSKRGVDEPLDDGEKPRGLFWLLSGGVGGKR